MSLKSYSPTSAARRGLVLVDRKDLWKGRPLKELVEGKRKTGGRNAQGRVTSRSRGGGHKRLYRFVDFKRFSGDDVVKGEVQRVEYDPNRSAFIALLKSQSEQGQELHSYILASRAVKVGSILEAGEKCDIRDGNTMLLKHIPVGTMVYNVELKIGKGGQIARAAGTAVQVMGRDDENILLKMPSGEIRKVNGRCRATIGVVSNEDHQNRSLAKAGRNRWLGWRSHVRGVAMNPIDHPHGGGEGRTSGGRHPVSPWGQSAKGKKTRSKRKVSDKFIVSRRKK
jgi:large subunit ribosomal protein L2